MAGALRLCSRNSAAAALPEADKKWPLHWPGIGVVDHHIDGGATLFAGAGEPAMMLAFDRAHRGSEIGYPADAARSHRSIVGATSLAARSRMLPWRWPMKAAGKCRAASCRVLQPMAAPLARIAAGATIWPLRSISTRGDAAPDRGEIFVKFEPAMPKKPYLAFERRF